MTPELTTLAFVALALLALGAEEWLTYCKHARSAQRRAMGLRAVRDAEREGRILRP